MHSSSLLTYLNDHLAGSVAAVQLLDHLIETRTDWSDKTFFEHLKVEIQADQETLRRIISVAGSEPLIRKAAAWIMEKFGWLKLELSNTHELGLLESLEALHLGITGKRALWQALAKAKPLLGVDEIDYQRLIARAELQADLVNRRRLDAAAATLR